MIFRDKQIAYKFKVNNLNSSFAHGVHFAVLLVLATMLFSGFIYAQDKKDKDKQMSEGQYAEINGARIYYEMEGTGEPMLLIHGYPLTGDLFKMQREELSKSYKVITPDLRGFGKSTAPDNNASLSIYAKDMFGLMDKLGIEKAIIGGHSMGGMTTLEMYKHSPERFRAMVLIDTAAIDAPIARKHLWIGFGKQVEEKGVASMVPLLIPQMLTGDARMNNMPLVTDMENMIKAASVNGAVGGANALAMRPDLTDVLGKIKVPTLIIVGVEDTLTPVAIAKNLHEAIPGSKLEIIPGGSHAVILEEPKMSNQAIMKWANAMR